MFDMNDWMHVRPWLIAMGRVQGWKKAHSHTSPGPTRGYRSKEGRCRDPSSEEPKEQVHLGNSSAGH